MSARSLTRILGFVCVAISLGLANQQRYVEGAALSVLALAYIGAHFAMRGAEEQNAALLEFVLAHRDAIAGEGASYRGRTLTRDTPLRRYFGCISGGLVSFRIRSALLLEGGWTSGLAWSAVTLVVGWWGVPWGPIYTVQTLAANLRGGERFTVGDLLKEAPPPAPT